MDNNLTAKYLALLKEYIRHTNIMTKLSKTRKKMGSSGVELNPLEWQILVNVISNDGGRKSMIEITNELGMHQSTFSKAVKYLCALGLLEKYQTEENRKNIILRPTEQARQLYVEQGAALIASPMSKVLGILSSLSDEQIASAVKALRELNEEMDPDIVTNDLVLIRK